MVKGDNIMQENIPLHIKERLNYLAVVIKEHNEFISELLKLLHKNLDKNKQVLIDELLLLLNKKGDIND